MNTPRETVQNALAKTRYRLHVVEAMKSFLKIKKRIQASYGGGERSTAN